MKTDIVTEQGKEGVHRKKYLPLAILVILLLSGTVVFLMGYYFKKVSWYTFLGSEGHYSKDTYLIGGTGEAEYTENMRIHYQYTVISGGAYFELSDADGNVVYRMEVAESCDGYIYISDFGAGVYYDHGGALNENSDVYVVLDMQVSRTNWERLLR